MSSHLCFSFPTRLTPGCTAQSPARRRLPLPAVFHASQCFFSCMKCWLVPTHQDGLSIKQAWDFPPPVDHGGLPHPPVQP